MCWIRRSDQPCDWIICTLWYIHIYCSDINSWSLWVGVLLTWVFCCVRCTLHYSDVIMSAMASLITGVSIVCSTVCSGADQRKHQSSSSLAFVWGIHRWLVDSPRKGPVTRKMFPFHDVIMVNWRWSLAVRNCCLNLLVKPIQRV